MGTAKMRLDRALATGLAALLALGLLFAPEPGRAEGGLLEFLFGPDPTPAPPQMAPPRARRDSAAGRRVKGAVGELRFGKPGTGFSSEPTAGGFCVRTCDGYYFPLIKSTRATRQQSCELACPSAPMEIYDGSTIESARNYKGQRYSALPVAFAFRHSHPRLAVLENPQFPEFAESQRPRAVAAMRFLDGELSGREFVAGDAFTIADITAFVALELTRLARIEIPAELPHLSRWREAMGARPSMAA